MMFRVSILPALGLLALGMVVLPAATTAQAPPSCTAKREACSAACTRQWGESGFGRTGCVARCAADQAVCESEAVARDGKQLWQEDGAPWLERRQREADEFLQGLRGPDGKPIPPHPAPIPAPASPAAPGGRGI